MKDYKFEEKQFEKHDLTYSHYEIENKDGDVVFSFRVPEPFDRFHPMSTDAFLRYQHSAKRATYHIFKFLLGEVGTGKGEMYFEPSGLYYKSTDKFTRIFLSGTHLQVGAINLGDKTLNEKIAEEFVGYLGG